MEAILNALQQQGAALQLLIQNQQHQVNPVNQPAITQTLMTHNITFEYFNPDEETFSAYKDRLENFFTLRQLKFDTPEILEVKRDVLLNCLKSKHYQLLSSLTTPLKPSEKSYLELVHLLEKQFTPVTNVHTERHKFLSKVQQATENLSNYIADLKVISQRCVWICPDNNCRKSIDSIFQAQFIRGIRDVHIREKILQMEPSTTLEKTLEVALSLEAARKQNLEEYSNGTGSSSVCKIETVSKRSFSKSRNQFNRQTSRTRNPSRNRSNNRRASGEDVIDKLGLKNCCLSCGNNNHVTTECRSKFKLKCSNCKKRGHTAKVCITTLLRKRNETVQNVSEFEEDYAINSIHYIDLSIKREKELSRKITITLQINNRFQEFEVDSGSPVTIMSKKDYDNLNLKLPIQPCPSVRFRAYNKSVIIPEGTVHVPVSDCWTSVDTKTSNN